MIQIRITNTETYDAAVITLRDLFMGFCIGAMCTLIILMATTIIYEKISNADDRVITPTQKQEFKKLMREELNDYFDIAEVTEK